MILIEINTTKSYLGKDIREWCMTATTDSAASLEIRRNYYCTESNSQPDDNTWYFIRYISEYEACKIYKDLNMQGYHLIIDQEKSPQKSVLEKYIDKATMGNYVNVEKLIKRFKSMADRDSLLTGNVTQRDLLLQIIGTIVTEAMSEKLKEGE